MDQRTAHVKNITYLRKILVVFCQATVPASYNLYIWKSPLHSCAVIENSSLERLLHFIRLSWAHTGKCSHPSALVTCLLDYVVSK